MYLFLLVSCVLLRKLCFLVTLVDCCPHSGMGRLSLVCTECLFACGDCSWPASPKDLLRYYLLCVSLMPVFASSFLLTSRASCVGPYLRCEHRSKLLPRQITNVWQRSIPILPGIFPTPGLCSVTIGKWIND